MGAFATIEVPCPNCGETIKFQSKSAGVGTYEIDHVPIGVVIGIEGEWERCECGKVVEIKNPDGETTNFTHWVK